MSEDDPRAQWRALPEPVRPEDWVAGRDEDPVPGSVQEASEQAETREARRVIEWGAGG